MTDIDLTRQESEQKKPKPKPVPITVNGDPVTVPDDKVSGLQIKEAAIAQGVPIQVGYVLFEITKKGREQVPDSAIVKVTKKSVFEAITGDVNS